MKKYPEPHRRMYEAWKSGQGVRLGVNTFLLILTFLDPTNLGTFTDQSKIQIQSCHFGDKVNIHVIPIPLGPNRVEGWFSVTNQNITMLDMSMIPDGTNIFEISTVCRGQTSEVSRVIFNLQRPPPKPMVFKTSAVQREIPMPPIPGQMVLPLPGGTNDTYTDYMERMKLNKRRSQ